MRAPSDHQSTALPWPLLVKISGALQAKRSQINFKFTCPRGRKIKRRLRAHAHVLNCAAEGVGDNTLLYVLLTEPEVGKLHVSLCIE